MKTRMRAISDELLYRCNKFRCGWGAGFVTTTSAAITTPIAIAGAYANRLSAAGDSMAGTRRRSIRHQPRRRADGLRQAAAPQRDDQRQHAAGDRGKEKCADRRCRSEQGAGRGEQLHVAGASRAKHIARQHEGKPEEAADDGASDADRAELRRRESEPDDGQRASQSVRNPPRAQIDHRRQPGGRGKNRDDERVRWHL